MGQPKHDRRSQTGFIFGGIALALLCLLNFLRPATDKVPESPGTTAGQPSPSPKTVRLISATQGGELASPSGRATLSIPPRALSADTDVSITELPPGEGPAVGPVFELQPDGLRFNSPARLTIRYKTTDVPKGYKPEDVAIMQVLPGPESQERGGLGAAAAAAARPPYQSLKTDVNPAAGTATAQLDHLSRYAARAYASFDLGDWDADLTGAFDFGQADAGHSGAADARSAYDLMMGELEAIVQVPPGREGQGWAWACLWLTFRVGPRQPRQEAPWYGNRDIVIPISHRGTAAPGTNTYDVHYSVWFASDDRSQRGISAGIFKPQTFGPGEGTLPDDMEKGTMPAAIGLAMPGIYWQAYSLRPGTQNRAVAGLSPYKPQDGRIIFPSVPLYRDHFYAVGISLFAAIKGRPARGTRPPEGGAMSFLAGDFTVLTVRIRRPGS